MSETKKEDLIEKVRHLANNSFDQSQPYNWFETLYQEAEKDANQVPWAKLKPHPELTNWLATQMEISSPKSAVVIGCGLGDDAEALQAFGYDVTAFDVSPTAIAWCRERFPDSLVNYQVADLFNLPESWLGKFDLVFECRNIQALPIKDQNNHKLEWRSQAISIVASLVKPGGKLLLISRIRPADSEMVGPPWGLSPEELSEFNDYQLQQVSDRSFLEKEEIIHIIRLFSKINSSS